jgi:hypothetical protein
MQVKMIEILGHCRDCFSADLYDENNVCVFEYSGYVPRIIPNSGEDDIRLKIDLETGKILNWKPPSQEEMDKFLTHCTKA